ncbi:hypothetical protein FDUTEX481_09154 [Tolypothrix sp. PCC 7601]|nr:hypothetical protein FDUTEX481_09154 [Tolypothrix sp. PCC 7601]
MSLWLISAIKQSINGKSEWVINGQNHPKLPIPNYQIVLDAFS